jgi:hypothetical protein
MTGLFGSFSGGAQDNEVVGEPDQDPKSSTVVPRLVEDVKRDVGEQRGNRRALRGSSIAFRHHPTLEHPSPNPLRSSFNICRSTTRRST